jgi:2-C-methyl-D-erythritol 2,4-cyclodiphosphate synthase
MMNTRIGFGFDSHEFKPGVPLRIGGLTLDHPEGLAGHSDGDVLLHAITDALLGAVAAGDIGSFFPPGDPRWKDADSAIFLNLAIEELEHAGYRIVNVDTTLVLAAPKIGPIASEMRARVADLLDVELNQVSIKAKTPEGLGLDHVAQCHAVALVERVEEPEELKSITTEIEAEPPLDDDVDDDVVEGLLSSVHGSPKKHVAPVYDTEDIT